MFPNLNEKFEQMINSMDPEALEKGLKAFSDFIHTEQGEKMAKELQNVDKQALLEKLSTLNESELANQLDTLDTETLSEKISQIDKNAFIDQLNNNPEMVDKLKQFLNN